VKKGYGSVVVVVVIAILALGALLFSGARSAVGRAYDMAEYKAASPYYQALALNSQVTGRAGKLPWGLVIVLGVVLGFLLLGWWFGKATPLVKEARLTYKAVRPRRAAGGGRVTRPRAEGLSALPPAPTTRALAVGGADSFEEGEVTADDDEEPFADRQPWRH